VPITSVSALTAGAAPQQVPQHSSASLLREEPTPGGALVEPGTAHLHLRVPVDRT